MVWDENAPNKFQFFISSNWVNALCNIKACYSLAWSSIDGTRSFAESSDWFITLSDIKNNVNAFESYTWG